MTEISKWQDNYITVNGIKLHYTRTGGDKPPIILSHGVTDNGLCWTPVAKQLEKKFDVIMVDARGHGLSEFSNDFSVNIMAKDLVELIESLNLSHRPILMGHSMGAQISTHVASIEPQLIKLLILEDPAWGMSFPLIPNFVLKRIYKPIFMRLLINPIIGLNQEELEKKCKKDNPKWLEDEIIPWSESKLQFTKNNYSFLIDSLMKSMEYDWFEINKNIECPVLLLTSDKGMTSKKTANKLVEEAWKEGKTVKIRNAGHNIRRENFEDFMRAINNFLNIE